MKEGWDTLIEEIKKENRKIKVKIMMYGIHDQLSYSDNWDRYNKVLDQYSKNNINEFIFNNKSTYEFFKTKGYPAKLFVNHIDIKNTNEYISENNKYENMRIGLYEAEDKFDKNIYNQLAAVSLIENHELDCAPICYKISMMARKYNINLLGTTGNLSKKDLYKKMARNDINLFVSFSDCTDTLPIESLELGTICLIGKNNQYFEGHEIEKYIVVEHEDDVTEIYKKILFSQQNRDKILALYLKWKEEREQASTESIKEILEN